MKPFMQTIEGKTVVQSGRITESAKTIIIDKCFFCGCMHIHSVGRVPDKFISGLASMGKFKANCETAGIEIELHCGTVVNNFDGYYLVDPQNMKRPDRAYRRIPNAPKRNTQLEAAFFFWEIVCCDFGEKFMSTSEVLFESFQCANRITNLYPYELTQMEFNLVLRSAGHHSVWHKGEYVVLRFAPKDTDCQCIDEWETNPLYPRVWHEVNPDFPNVQRPTLEIVRSEIGDDPDDE